MRQIKRFSTILLQTFFASLATGYNASATPLVFNGTRAGEALGSAVACSKASIGSHRRSLIAASASGYASGRGTVVIYDPEAKGGRPRKLRLVAKSARCNFGSSVSFIADINGDGIDDLVASGSCEAGSKQESLFIFKSVRKGAVIGFTACGSNTEERGIAGISRHRDGFLLQYADNTERGLYGVFMTSSNQCSVTRAKVTPRGVSEKARDGSCGSDVAGPCVASHGCQAHIGGRLHALEVRGIPGFQDRKGRIEAWTRGSRATPATLRATSNEIDSYQTDIVSAEPTVYGGPVPLMLTSVVTPNETGPLAPGTIVNLGSNDMTTLSIEATTHDINQLLPTVVSTSGDSLPSEGTNPSEPEQPVSSIVATPASDVPWTPTADITPGSVDQVAPGVVIAPGNTDSSSGSIAIAPGSAGLPAPEVSLLNQNMANVILPKVSVRLTEAQRDRALRLLLNRGSSKQKAEKALENPKNFITTYIVTIVAEGAVVAAQAVMLKARMVNSRGSARIRKVRTRRNRVTIARLTSGTTYSVSYRVEISLKKPRTVLGVTESSKASRVRVP